MLEIKNVSKNYGEKVGVSDLSLTVSDGEIFGFVGPNGAGKTTLIKAIVGIHAPSSGDILLNDVSILKDPLAFKKEIAYIPDNPDIYPSIRGIDYLNFLADIYELPKENREKEITKYAKLFELEDALGNVISSYSHGMRQKLVIIGALIHKPKLLVLDEPFVGLDPKSTKLLKDIMRGLSKKNVAIFFSSHVLEVVEKLCDRVGIIKEGKLLTCCKPEELTKSLEDFFLEETSK